MIREKFANELERGDILSNNGATVDLTVICHHGTMVYIDAIREDGSRQIETVPVGLVVPVWVEDASWTL